MEHVSSQQLSGPRRRATRSILAVGDDRPSLNALAQPLGQLGYMVVLSDSSGQALELIAGRGFDLVLLDRTGDDLGGLHMVQEIRGSRDTADLPLLFLTARGEPDAIVQALRAGADDCVAKPCDFAVLAARIERILGRAARIDTLKRSNLALDARIAARAIELGEMRADLVSARADRARLIASVQGLHDELDRLQSRG
ncbi:response regulator transcription factor [Sphingomonas hengshuiensis]|uniref:Response regulatory domain-containing protein n=1 Tax=Sphingomonas hengshuiensis TaxID=1609977 RepID=A0A7U4JB08_9SPHN|nr:response regulator [Sphingomonas hengshuiensis]AJP73493.1 hypothetical protein TS85_19435 [Sphingomonas hengshuiensis]